MQRLVPGFAPTECCDNFHDSFDDLKNWYVHELLKTMSLVNVGLQDDEMILLSSSVSFSMGFSGSWDCVIFLGDDEQGSRKVKPVSDRKSKKKGS